MDDQSYATSGGWALGTMPYMSPEQALGKPLDQRSDLFSFGVTLYQMATGQMPFRGNTTGVLFLAIVQNAPIPVTTFNQNVPVELQQIIDKCLAKESYARYQNASEIRTELGKLLAAPRTPAATGGQAEARQVAVASAVSAVVRAQATPFPQPKSDSVRAEVHESFARKVDGDGGLGCRFAGCVRAVLESTQEICAQRQRYGCVSRRHQQHRRCGIRRHSEDGTDDWFESISVPECSSREQSCRHLKALMTRGVDAKLTPEIAKDLCQRAGAKAFIVPSIASLGSEYVVGLRAVQCGKGGLHHSQQ